MYRVLHIGSDLKCRRVAKKILEDEGFEVVEARDGVSGVDKALEIRPDAVLVDIDLPDMNGHAVVLRLRGEKTLRDLPLLAIAEDESDRDMSMAVGCNSVIAKPIDPANMISRIKASIEARDKAAKRVDDVEPLRLQAQDLAKRLQTKIEDLEAARKRLAGIEKVQAEFYRNLSHELSTPLTPVIGYIKMLTSEELGALSSMQLRALQSIDRGFNRVRAVIENLLDMTALSTGKMSFFSRYYDFNQVAGESAELCMYRFEERNIELEREISGRAFRAYGDPDRLKRAMVQLLENAVKFCGTGGKVQVATKKESDLLHFLVFDSGQGIPEEEIRAIFTTFYQIDGSPTREHGGAGLGLALARKIVERFGGAIWAESPPKNVSEKLSWAKTLVALRVPEVMAGETPPPK